MKWFKENIIDIIMFISIVNIVLTTFQINKYLGSYVFSAILIGIAFILSKNSRR